MSVFDLVFIGVFLTTVTSIVLVFGAVIRGRHRKAGHITARLGVFLALYMGALIAVSLLTPQRVLGMREDRCFDDWCLAVDECSLSRTIGQLPASADGVFYIFYLRVSSRAGRVSQRAPDAWVYLTDIRLQCSSDNQTNGPAIGRFLALKV